MTPLRRCSSPVRQFPILSTALPRDLSMFIRPSVVVGSICDHKVVPSTTRLFSSKAEDPTKQTLTELVLQMSDSDFEDCLESTYRKYVSQDKTPLPRCVNYLYELVTDENLIHDLPLQKRAILIEYMSRSHWNREVLQFTPLHLLTKIDAYTHSLGRTDLISLLITKEPSQLIKKSAGKYSFTPIETAIRFNCPPSVMKFLVDSRLKHFGIPTSHECRQWQQLAANLAFVYDKIASAYRETSTGNPKNPYYANTIGAIERCEPHNLLKFLKTDAQLPTAEEFEQLAVRGQQIEQFLDYLGNIKT